MHESTGVSHHHPVEIDSSMISAAVKTDLIAYSEIMLRKLLYNMLYIIKWTRHRYIEGFHFLIHVLSIAHKVVKKNTDQ